MPAPSLVVRIATNDEQVFVEEGCDATLTNNDGVSPIDVLRYADGRLGVIQQSIYPLPARGGRRVMTPWHSPLLVGQNDES